jgi:hypothetical protein
LDPSLKQKEKKAPYAWENIPCMMCPFSRFLFQKRTNWIPQSDLKAHLFSDASLCGGTVIGATSHLAELIPYGWTQISSKNKANKFSPTQLEIVIYF